MTARGARLRAATTMGNGHGWARDRHVDWVERLIAHPDKPKTMILYGRRARTFVRGLS